MRILSKIKTEFDKTPHHTLCAYAGYMSGWYVILCNKAGDQLGDAHYDGLCTAKEALQSAIKYAGEYGVNEIHTYKKAGGLKKVIEV